MNFHWIDWVVVVCVFMFFIILPNSTKKYNQSTADFLVANRCAGRYMLTLAEGMAGLGAAVPVTIRPFAAIPKSSTRSDSALLSQSLEYR